MEYRFCYMIKIYTIGVSGKGLDDIVAVMDAVGVRQLVDVRLWRASKFAPWAGGDNLERILGARYKSVPQLAPRADLLARYKSGVTDWAGYVREFNDILAVRAPEKLFTRDSLHNVCFLCMERRADKCHRRLVAQYMAQHFDDVSIVHL